MPEPELIQRQRELLRAFRQATARRAEAEAEAVARRQAEREAADAALNQARQTAAAQLAEAHKAQEEAQAALSQASLQGLLEQTSPSPPAPTPGADPAQELARCVSIAVGAVGGSLTSFGIPDAIAELQRWREAQARRHRRLAIATAVAVVILMVICGATANFLDWTWRTAQLYRSAVASLEAGQWEQARADLQQLLAIDSNYKDAQTLLRESYYQPAIAALEAGQWDKAQADLQQLVSIDNNYKDAQTLLRESYYRSIVAALEAGQQIKVQAACLELLQIVEMSLIPAQVRVGCTMLPDATVRLFFPSIHNSANSESQYINEPGRAKKCEHVLFRCCHKLFKS
jgi:tetratricopeptide (TPR) repeat protein